jgi:pSer/pThr/pTyr-binding forkhead associated (FHA) protein
MSASSSQVKLPPESSIVLAGREYLLNDDRITLGRATENKIILDHPSVSRQHAEFFVTAEGVFIEDLGSRNGIKVKGKRVQRAELKHNDRFEIGDLEGQFFQKHPNSKTQGPTEETAVGLAVRASLADRFSALPPLRKKIIVGAGVALLMVALVQIMGGGSGETSLLVQTEAAVKVSPCTLDTLVKGPTNTQMFESCREHEDLGNYRLARACFARMANTKEVCDAVERVKLNQESLSQLRFQEGSNALDNYYYDLAIVKFQEVLLIADDETEVREFAKQRLLEAQKKKMIRR